MYPATGVTAACAQSPRVSMFVTLAAATSVTTPFPFTVEDVEVLARERAAGELHVRELELQIERERAAVGGDVLRRPRGLREGDFSLP